MSAADPSGNYRAISSTAVSGLTLGLVSGCAWFLPALVVVPAVAALVNWLALRRLARYESELSGYGLALAGMGLSLISLIGAPMYHLAQASDLSNQARQYGEEWLELLQQDRPEEAVMMTITPGERATSQGDAWEFFRTQPHRLARLQAFVTDPTIRALLALGDDAQIQFFDNEESISRKGHARIDNVYSVTYEDAGARKTFFILVSVYRETLDDGTFTLTIVHWQGGHRPARLAAQG